MLGKIIVFIIMIMAGMSLLKSMFHSETGLLIVGGIVVVGAILWSIGKSVSNKVEIEDRDLAELAEYLNEKYGLEVNKIDLENHSIVFQGDNRNTKEERGEFYEKNKSFYDFKDSVNSNIKKFLKKEKSRYKLLETEAIKGEEVVELTVNLEEKKNNSEYEDLSETLGIKGTNGEYAELIDLEEDKEKDHLKLVFSYVNGINNIKAWNNKIEEMKQTLGFNFNINDKQAEKQIEIIKVPTLETALEFYKKGFKWENFLEKGKIFEGMTTRGAYYRNIDTLTHTGVAGQSGSGKSVQLHLTLKSVFYNMEQFEKIYLGDLKGGLELSFLEDLGSDKLSFFGEAYEVLPIILNCELEMDARMAYMKANRIRNIKGNIILFIVDEYKQLNDLQMGKSGVSREVGNLIVNKIDRISALGRAMNVKLFLQSQNFTTDSIESSTRNNIQSLVLMKTKNPEIQNACIPYSLREDMPNPADFTTGEKILLDSESGETTLIQALFTEPNEEVSIDNSMKAYEMGKENQAEIKNIAEEVKPFKIKVLEKHLENAENLNEEVLAYYQKQYEELTGEVIDTEATTIEATTKTSSISKVNEKDIEEKIEKDKEENDSLLNEMNSLLSKLQ